MRYLSVTLLSVLLFAQSCSYNQQPKTVVIDNQFSMLVPSFMKEDKEVRPGSPFQYANRFRNLYSTVFFDKKDAVKLPVEQYYNSQIQIIKNVLEKPMVTDSAGITIDGQHAIHTEVFGKMQGEYIYYSHLLIEAPDKYYQVCVWTRGEDRKLKYAKDIEGLLYSFKLVK
ncbi:MAG: hypothetical protein U0T32_14890 [Chitinophagales bacterium]